MPDFLETHIALFRTARVGIGVFLWLIICHFFEGHYGTQMAIVQAAMLYLLSQTALALAAPLAGESVRAGLKRTIGWSIVCYIAALYFLVGSLGGYFGPMMHVGLIGFALLLGVFSALYWLPYTQRAENRFAHAGAIGLGLVPLIVGLWLSDGFIQVPYVVTCAAALAALSLLPLSRISEVREYFPLNYRETFGVLFDHAHRRLVTTSLAAGMESAVFFFVWPIVVFEMLGRSFILTGALFAVLIALGPLVRVMSRQWHARVLRENPAESRVLIAVSSWIARLSAGSFVPFLLVDVYYAVSSEKVAVNQLDRDHRADNGYFIDHFTIVKEIATALGRIVSVSLFVLLLSAFQLSVAVLLIFVFAALAALLAYSSGGAEEPFV